ncbi:protein kinase [Streptomyces sp. NPDC002790]|uniref:serine/threonine-protein kinase n=1 Tax=Streptomyces sp. NPDC002790 TaxID=3154431 RepID=UPI0033244E23
MGEVFAGRYELADPIGRGGVGAVWRAWDHRRRRYVAAKVLQQSDAHTLLRFVREQALRIDHPHVLAPASWAADDDKVLFTMDLVAGGSLVHLVADYGPLPPQFACVLLDQLLAGLTAVHAEGVVHRDIKPANLLLEATGTGLPHLRVSDFGIAMRKGEPRLTEADYVVGTPGYFAPEQELGAEPDFPADLFAVGLVALHLLEGAMPDSRALIEHFEEHGTPRAPQGVPGPLWGVLAGLLQPDPDTRFRTATGARKALLAATELLPEPGPDDELIEVFDQLGPLPPGFGPGGPPVRGRRARPVADAGSPVAGAGSPLAGPGLPVAGPGLPVAGEGSPVAGPETPVHEAETAGQAAAPPIHGPETPAHGADTTGHQVGTADPGTNAARPEGGSAGRSKGPVTHSAGASVPHAPPPPANALLPPRPLAPPAASASVTPAGSPAPPAPQLPPASQLPPAPKMPPAPAAGLTPPLVSPTEPSATQPQPPGAHTPPTAHPEFVPEPIPVRPEPAPVPEPAPEPAPEPPLRAPHSSAPSPLDPPQAHHSLYASGDGEVPRPRPGPPVRVTIPVLLLALACFAVGIWALTRP